ncbi:MAG: hypothetical protein NTY08_18305 [Proteobacteria bacterium]|nr:hypothetical protein [Pseudomonadota bacterium]
MRVCALIGVFALLGACGKKSSSGSDSSSSTVSETAAKVQELLSQAYPGSLAISVFPTDTTSAKLAVGDADAPAPESLKAKAAEAQEYLAGKANSCLPAVFLRPTKDLEEGCYEFDQDMIDGTKDGHKHGTANGKSTITGSSEACLVSFARSKIKEISGIIDQGLGLQQGMICQAVKDQVDVAAAQTEAGIDLKNTLGTAAGNNTDSRRPTFEVSEATIAKDADGVYRVTISVTMTKDGKSTSQTYKLNHVPDSTDNSTYHGVMSITRNDPQNPGNTTVGKRYISVSYTRSIVDSVSHLKTELRSARMDTKLDSLAFNADGTLNFNAGTADDGSYTGFSQANDAVSGMLFVGFDLNADNDTGTFEYWQNPGGNYDEAARGMVFKLEQNATTGRLEGCGMSGAAMGATMDQSLSIRKSIKAGSSLGVTGSYHPFFNTATDQNGSGSCPSSGGCTRTGNPSASWNLPAFSVAANVTAAAVWAKDQHSNYVSRQCVGQSAAGVYEIDPAKITDTAGYELFKPTDRSDLVIAKPDRPAGPPPARK